jgi:hypothetical protein
MRQLKKMPMQSRLIDSGLDCRVQVLYFRNHFFVSLLKFNILLLELALTGSRNSVQVELSLDIHPYRRLLTFRRLVLTRNMGPTRSGAHLHQLMREFYGYAGPARSTRAWTISAQQFFFIACPTLTVKMRNILFPEGRQPEFTPRRLVVRPCGPRTHASFRLFILCSRVACLVFS